MRTKFYIVRPEYTRPAEDEPNVITGVQFWEAHAGRPTAFTTYDDADLRAAHLYRDCGWIAPLVVAGTGEAARDRHADATAKALACYAGQITRRQATAR